MKVIKNINEFPQHENVVLTSGTFDGCHLAHVKIIEQLIFSAKNKNAKSVVLTYWPHPRIVLNQADDNFKLLNTLDERIENLSKYDIDYLVILKFTKSFSKTPSSKFIKEILIDKLQIKKVIIGYNHRFGKNREGSFDFLKTNHKELGFEIEEIPKQYIDNENISSTQIRNYLLNGDCKNATKLLGKPYSIIGKIVKGNSLGRTINFPTANILISDFYKLIPKSGVYAVEVMLDKKLYKGMLNIGLNPTININNEIKIEVHILEFNNDIYNKTVTINFIHYIREEKKFNSLQDLSIQLKKDKNMVESLFLNA